MYIQNALSAILYLIAASARFAILLQGELSSFLLAKVQSGWLSRVDPPVQSRDSMQIQ